MRQAGNLFHQLFSSSGPTEAAGLRQNYARIARNKLLKPKNDDPHCCLLQGPSGYGLSSVLTQVALDSTKAADSKPVFFFIDNETQYKYLLGLIQTLIKLKPDKQKYPFIRGESARDTTDTGKTSSKKTAEQLKTETQSARIIFITKRALVSSAPQLEELAQHHGTQTLVYDDIHTLRYSETGRVLDHLQRLISTIPKAKLLASINDPWHESLQEEIFHSADLASFFPVANRIRLEKDDALGLKPTNGRTSAIPFCSIADGTTIAKVLASPSEEHVIAEALSKMMSKINTNLGQKNVVIKTSSPEASQIIEKILKATLDPELWEINNSNRRSGLRFLTGTNDHNKILITTNLLEQIHLPPGTITDFGYFDAATSSTDLARQLSVASTDPNTRIYFLEPLYYEGSQYKFPDKSYTPPGIGRSYSHERINDIPLVHQAFIDDAIKAALIQDHGKWENLLNLLLSRDSDMDAGPGKTRLIKQLQLSHNNLTVEQIEAVINGEDYNPTLFRDFLEELLAIRSVQRSWVSARESDLHITHSIEIDHDEITLTDIIRNFPRLTGVFNLDEARIALQDFDPLWQFHLGFIGGFPDLSSFTNRERLEILLDLMTYLRIDKDVLLQEASVDIGKLSQRLGSQFHSSGLDATNLDLTLLSKHLGNYYLLVKLFPQLTGLTEQINLRRIDDDSIPYAMRLSFKPEGINFQIQKGSKL